MLKQKYSSWRNWGDHPVVVLIGLVVAFITIFVFITGKENLLQLQKKDLHPLTDTAKAQKEETHKEETKSVAQDPRFDPLLYYGRLMNEALTRLTKITSEYDSIKNDPKSTELIIALKKLEEVGAERWYWQTKSFYDNYFDNYVLRNDTTKKSIEETAWEEYSNFILDEELSSMELDALLIIKRAEPKKFKRSEGEQRINYLNEKLDKLSLTMLS